MSRRTIVALMTVGVLLSCGNTTMEQERTLSAGERIFKGQCTLCHGMDGRLGLNDAKDLSASTLSAAEVEAVVRKGRGAMMGYERMLNDEQIKAVVDHVLTFRATE